ncbi:dTDP-4-dehydrorhamnose 3,5-epimerase [Parafrigoribacterium mesophilum]|uniref:dTDP-4-dehydrorhamnose 3,5-epimerase family protein n=1 Tax=Parafrigoribacterium mesophilum TaxID=433646 RepID=UPI0031FDB3A8
MNIRELKIAGAFEITPQIHADERGSFLESYRFEPWLSARKTPMVWKQTNLSVSRAGVLRGIHYAMTPPGQAKYVTVVAGSGLDFVVDLRVGSPSFGQWDVVRLDTSTRRSVFIEEGLGHAFFAYEDGTTLNYLVSEVFNPAVEFAIDPLDAEIGLELPVNADELIVSPRDQESPTLNEAAAQGKLPSWSAHFAAAGA